MDEFYVTEIEVTSNNLALALSSPPSPQYAVHSWNFVPADYCGDTDCPIIWIVWKKI